MFCNAIIYSDGGKRLESVTNSLPTNKVTFQFIYSFILEIGESEIFLWYF